MQLRAQRRCAAPAPPPQRPQRPHTPVRPCAPVLPAHLPPPDAACRQVHEDDNAIHMVEELGAGGELFDRIIELGVFTGARGLHAGCVRALACGTLYGGTATRCALAPLTAVLCLPPCLPAEVDAVHLIHQVVDGVQ